MLQQQLVREPFFPCGDADTCGNFFRRQASRSTDIPFTEALPPLKCPAGKVTVFF